MPPSRLPADRPDPARLFLITPPIADAEAFRPSLAAAMAAADIACVLIRTATADLGEARRVVEPLAALVQDAGAALLVADDGRLAARIGADGVHVAAADADLGEIVAAMRPGRIVGVGALVGRDAAMEAGEAGVDYVMFGAPDGPEDEDEVCERAAWWAEIFNVPCVAYAHRPELVGRLARTGAEFVALCDGVWDDPALVVAAAARALVADDHPLEVAR